MTVVVADKAGRLGNRLLVSAHLAASGLEHGFTVADPAFDEYSTYFPAIRRDILARCPAKTTAFGRNGVLRRLLYWFTFGMAALIARLPILHGRLIRLPSGHRLDLSEPDFVQTASTRSVLVQGWLFRDPRSLEKQADAIREHFRPDPRLMANAALTVSSLRDTSDVVVGIHARGTDYRVHLGGRFYFAIHEYQLVMESVRDLFEEKSVGFLLCSDESLDIEPPKGTRMNRSSGHLVEDLCSLTRCDFIVGPPSSFTIWASFYGRVPLFMMTKAGQRPSLTDFRIIPEFRDDSIRQLYW